MHILDRFHPEKYTASRVQLVCMAVVSVITALMLALGDRCSPALYQLNVLILSAAALLFVGVSLGKPMSKTTKGLLLLGLSFVLWYLILCLTDLLGLTSTPEQGLRYFLMTPLLEYLMLLPFAAIRKDEKKPWGLYLIGGAFCIGSELLLMLFGLQVLNITPPGFENILMVTSHEMCVSWLANVYASVFMIAICFKVCFICISKRRWLKVLFILSIIPDFCAITLSYSQATLLLGACLVSGALFFTIHPGKWSKADLKQILLGLGAAVCVILVILMGASGLQKARSTHLKHVAAAQQTISQQAKSPVDSNSSEAHPEAVPAAVSSQESHLHRKLKSILSLSGRTEIWKQTLKNISEDPKILLFGLSAGDKIYLPYGKRVAAHTHNAWMQTLIQTGLVGLILACILTWIALKNSFQVLFSSWASLPQKEISLLILTIMAFEFLEPYLFYVRYPLNFPNIAFVLCLGYVVRWNTDARKAAKAN